MICRSCSIPIMGYSEEEAVFRIPDVAAVAICHRCEHELLGRILASEAYAAHAQARAVVDLAPAFLKAKKVDLGDVMDAVSRVVEDRRRLRAIVDKFLADRPTTPGGEA